MNIKSRSTPKKTIIISSIVVLGVTLVAAGVYVYAFKGTILGWSPLTSTQTSDTVDYGPATEEEIDSGNKTKAQNVNNSSQDNPKVSDKVENEPRGNTGSIGISITVANQNGDLLQVRTLIETVTTTGQCTLTATRSGSAPVTKTADIQPMASTSTCKGFDVPISELSTGTWTLTVVYKNQSITGSATKTVTIKS